MPAESKSGCTVASSPYAWPYDESLAPENTALLVIDMQIDFCGKGGYVDCMGYDLSLTRAPIEPLMVTLKALRAAGFHVMHTREGHMPSLADCPTNKLWRSQVIGAGIGDRGPRGRILVRGEEGWEIIDELKPLEGEVVFDKPGKGAFLATNLDFILQRKGIRNLIFAGVTTDVCVSTTMREANDLGYECLVLSDCTMAANYGNYVATLKTTVLSGGILGCVAASADLLQAIGAEVPPELEAKLSYQDLGNDVTVRMPVLPDGVWMPKAMSDVVVGPKKRVAGAAQGAEVYVAGDPYLWPFDGDFRRENTALLVVDFQRDFAEAGGYLSHLGYDISPCRAIIPAAAGLLAAMRRRGFRIIHTREGYASDLSDCPRPRKARGGLRSSGCAPGEAGPLGRFLVRSEGGWGFVPELAPLPEEIIIDKPALGAFSFTNLELILRNLSMRNLVIMGLTADVAVLTTMRQANDRGFECLLVSDCVASVSEDIYLSALMQVKMSSGIFGSVATSADLWETLDGLPP